MKRIVFLFLSILIIGLSTCKKHENDKYITYYEIAAVVGYDSDYQSPMLFTSLGTFIAPQLQNVFLYYVENGDAILANMIFKDEQKTSMDNTVLVSLDYALVAKETPKSTDGGESAGSEFIASIDSIAPYDMVNNVAFLLFFHTAPVLQQYNYEMTYEPDQAAADDIPTVYFRAKENGKDDVNATKFIQRICAFNLNNFVDTYKDPKNSLKINIKFYTGNKNGEDVYTDWKNNPLDLKIKK